MVKVRYLLDLVLCVLVWMHAHWTVALAITFIAIAVELISVWLTEANKTFELLAKHAGLRRKL